MMETMEQLEKVGRLLTDFDALDSIQTAQFLTLYAQYKLGLFPHPMSPHYKTGLKVIAVHFIKSIENFTDSDIAWCYRAMQCAIDMLKLVNTSEGAQDSSIFDATSETGD
jgi:hypothetical protein